MDELKLITRINLLKTRGTKNENIVRKLERKLRKFHKG